MLSTSQAANAAFDHEHRVFSELLSEVVVVTGHHSRVDYPSLIKKRERLDAYLDVLSGVSQREFDNFSDKQQLAFLINAYNSFQLKEVIDNYPIKSIKDVGSFFKSPWDKAFFNLFGKPTTLNMIEHEYIRGQFKEPRIHFAVNCASISCPPLMPHAYVGARLDEQLNSSAMNFLSDSTANRYDAKSQTLYLSKIFDWYEDDFGDDVATYVAQYMTALKSVDLRNVDVEYTDYNWNLNISSK